MAVLVYEHCLQGINLKSAVEFVGHAIEKVNRLAKKLTNVLAETVWE
jgi:hypothetical protein